MVADLRFWIDAAVLAAYFVLVVRIGLSCREKDQTLEGFALGGRSIPWWAVLASIIAAETSAGTFIGTPGEGYALRNYTYLQLAIGTILARCIVAFLFLRPYYENKVYSIYEYLEVRFGPGTRRAASALFLVTRVLASGTRLYVSAIVLVVGWELFTGTHPTAHQEILLYVGAITVMCGLTALYTVIGGIRAVIWTDLLQASLMLGTAVIAVLLLLNSIPGHFSGLRTTLRDFQDVTFFASGTQPGLGLWDNIKAVLSSEYTIWAGLIGSTFTTMATHGTDQDMVQRMLTAKDVRRSRRSLILSGLADIPVVFLFLTIGILLSVHYELRPNPQLPAKTNEIFVFYILTEMPVGLRGLLIAGLFATAMGSLSAALNALATSFTRDWYLPHCASAPDDAHTVRAARRFTALFAVLMIFVASLTAVFVIYYPKSRIIPIALGIFGYTYGSLLGIFLTGLLTRNRGCDVGNGIAMLGGFLAVAVLSGLPNDLAKLAGLPPIAFLANVPLVEFPWRIFFGTVVTFSIAVLFPRRIPPVHP